MVEEGWWFGGGRNEGRSDEARGRVFILSGKDGSIFEEVNFPIANGSEVNLVASLGLNTSAETKVSRCCPLMSS